LCKLVSACTPVLYKCIKLFTLNISDHCHFVFPYIYDRLFFFITNVFCCKNCISHVSRVVTLCAFCTETKVF
jgi:hypothetical protein